MQNTIKLVLAIAVALFIASIFFRFLVKVGFIVLLVLAIIYLYQRVIKGDS